MGCALGSYDLDMTTNTISGQKANTSHIHFEEWLMCGLDQPSMLLFEELLLEIFIT